VPKRLVPAPPSLAGAIAQVAPPSPPEAPPKKKVSAARVRARELGIRAERIAAEHLSRGGLSILGANVRVGRFEIDLLARDGAVLVIVEVRARGPGALVRALDSVDGRKQARLRAAGKRLWSARFARDRSLDRVRFDCVSVSFGEDGAPLVEHVRAAF
jgi:putative endonuclease